MFVLRELDHARVGCSEPDIIYLLMIMSYVEISACLVINKI